MCGDVWLFRSEMSSKNRRIEEPEYEEPSQVSHNEAPSETEASMLEDVLNLDFSYERHVLEEHSETDEPSALSQSDAVKEMESSMAEDVSYLGCISSQGDVTKELSRSDGSMFEDSAACDVNGVIAASIPFNDDCVNSEGEISKVSNLNSSNQNTSIDSDVNTLALQHLEMVKEEDSFDGGKEDHDSNHEDDMNFSILEEMNNPACHGESDHNESDSDDEKREVKSDVTVLETSLEEQGVETRDLDTLDELGHGQENIKRKLFQDKPPLQEKKSKVFVMSSSVLDGRPVALKAFNSGLSGMVENYSTPIKGSLLDADLSLPSTADSESDLSSILSLEDEQCGNTSIIESEDEGRLTLEVLPIVRAFLEDEAVQGDESKDSFCELEKSTALSRACIMNDLKLYKDQDTSVNEAILKIMRLYIKNKESKSALQRILDTMCSLLPEGHKMPTSVYSIFEYVESLAPDVPVSLHYYCKRCLFYYGTQIVIDQCCQICGIKTEFGRFYIYDIACLIKYFFEHRNLAALIDAEAEKDSKNCHSRTVRSLKDGSVYKALNGNRGKYDINFILGSDGVRIRKGSSKELWLALVTISELPIHLQRSFLSVVGVWYDEKVPDMKTFLKPFSETMQGLDHKQEIGIEWTHPLTKEVNRSFVRLLVCVLDAPARAMVQNVQQFNGRYGCNVCEIKLQKSQPVPGKPELKRKRVYYFVADPKLRTKERMLMQAERVLAEGREHVKGVRGLSALSIIPSVDISQCIVPEYLHCVLLGVVKQLLTIWIDKIGPWSITHKIPEIDDFLKTFKHPDFVHRRLRQLSKLSYWKASDFYYFLLFESLLSLSGRLPDLYFQHFTLLVKGIFTFLKSSISESYIDEGDVLLKLFVSDFEKLYGSRELTHNVHQLIHLGLCVRRFGPLHCFSAFPFEDLNGLIARTTHGTNNVDQEIVTNIKICQGINILQNVVEGSDGLELRSRYSEGEFLGCTVSISTPNELLPFLVENEVPKIYSRAKLGYDTYTSEVHKTLSSENYHVMWTEGGVVRYGSIKYFAETRNDNFVVLQSYTVNQTKVIFNRETLKSIENIIPVENSNIYVTTFNDIVPSLVKVGKIGSYIYKRPNLYRYVL